MLVRGVGVDADVGTVFPDETLAANGFTQPDDHVVFGEALDAIEPEGGRRWRAISDQAATNDVDFTLRSGVAGDLIGGEDSFKLADEIGGADDFFAERAQEFDRSGIDHGDVHDVVVGRVLHGDLFLVLEESLEAGVQFLPTRVLSFGAGERVEAALLDAVDEFERLAIGRDEVIPAARDVRLGIEAKDACGDGIAVMVVVEEPAVERGFAEGCLDGVEIHTDNDKRSGGVSGVGGANGV